MEREIELVGEADYPGTAVSRGNGLLSVVGKGENTDYILINPNIWPLLGKREKINWLRGA